MDALVDTAGWVTKGKGQNHPTIGIYPLLAEKLKGTPRFLLDDNAIHTAAELTLGRPKVLLEAMGYIRVPYPAMWIEWSESGRANLRAKFPDHSRYELPERPIPKRVGFLLETEDGRKGQATWVWESPIEPPEINVPNIGFISPYFDLDTHFPLRGDRAAGIMAGNLAHLWSDNPIQLAALRGIWETAEHKPSPWGAHQIASHPYQINAAYADVVGEYIMIWSIMMLLTSSRKIIDLTPVELTRLNRARVKRNKPPLLDHTRVTIHLSNAERENRAYAPLGYARKSPRVHMVSRYLARRGNKHWIVEPYWRGSGETIARHVSVKN
jgi:hypothetical protein